MASLKMCRFSVLSFREPIVHCETPLVLRRKPFKRSFAARSAMNNALAPAAVRPGPIPSQLEMIAYPSRSNSFAYVVPTVKLRVCMSAVCGAG